MVILNAVFFYWGKCFMGLDGREPRCGKDSPSKILSNLLGDLQENLDAVHLEKSEDMDFKKRYKSKTRKE
jgi:hypothetical protein